MDLGLGWRAASPRLGTPGRVRPFRFKPRYSLPRSPFTLPPRLVVTWVGFTGMSRAFRRAHACLLQVGLLTPRLGALARHTPGPCGLLWARPGPRPLGGGSGSPRGDLHDACSSPRSGAGWRHDRPLGLGSVVGSVPKTAAVRHRRSTGRQCRCRGPAGPFGGTPSAVAPVFSHGLWPARLPRRGLASAGLTVVTGWLRP